MRRFAAGLRTLGRLIRGRDIGNGQIQYYHLSDASTGSYPVASSDSEVSTGATSYTKVKEIWSPYGGTFSVYFELREGDSGLTVASGRIYVNGGAVGTERTTSSTTYQTYTEDITIGAGSLIQIYAKVVATYTADVRNFRIRESAPKVFSVIT